MVTTHSPNLYSREQHSKAWGVGCRAMERLRCGMPEGYRRGRTGNPALATIMEAARNTRQIARSMFATAFVRLLM